MPLLYGTEGQAAQAPGVPVLDDVLLAAGRRDPHGEPGAAIGAAVP